MEVIDGNETWGEILQRKLNAVHMICDTHEIDDKRRAIIIEKVRRGHAEHQQRPEEIDCMGELVGEMADPVGYMGNLLAAAIADPDAPQWSPLHDEFVAVGQEMWDILDRIAEMGDGFLSPRPPLPRADTARDLGEGENSTAEATAAGRIARPTGNGKGNSR